jgi:hypothetical protein
MHKKFGEKINKRKIIEEDLDLFKFYDIKLLVEEELKKLSDNELKQYFCRLNRWNSFFETQLDLDKKQNEILFI